jgi:signal peptidase I
VTKKSLAISLIVVFFLGAVAVGVYRVFFLWMIRVPTGAMANTILPGDHLVVHRLLGGISRGDIVVFRYPDKDEYYVARVIGLPGESIQLRRKLVYINDRVLDEQRVMVESEHNGYDPLTELGVEGTGPYRVYYTQHASGDEESLPDDSGEFGVTAPFQIPADSYFILGDNRDNSYDSRFLGGVPRNLIWGKPSIIYFSVTMPNEDTIRSERIFKRVH